MHDHDHDAHADAFDPHSFDDKAATWDDPSKELRAANIATAIRSAVPLTSSMAMLEYGAGTGLVTQQLQHEVGEITLADTSAGMREVMKNKMASGALRPAAIWAEDLGEERSTTSKFDLIVTSMVLHHIPDTNAILSNFYAMLNPGGHVAIVDLDLEDGSFHGENFHGHHGFDRGEMAEKLTKAGFVQVKVDDCANDDGAREGFSLFLATAQRQ